MKSEGLCRGIHGSSVNSSGASIGLKNKDLEAAGFVFGCVLSGLVVHISGSIYTRNLSLCFFVNSSRNQKPEIRLASFGSQHSCPFRDTLSIRFGGSTIPKTRRLFLQGFSATRAWNSSSLARHLAPHLGAVFCFRCVDLL